jgi:hypothetical protein
VALARVHGEIGASPVKVIQRGHTLVEAVFVEAEAVESRAKPCLSKPKPPTLGS